MMTLKVNGRDHQIDADPDTPLLYVLRDDLKLNAAKFGSGLGQCGACTGIADGNPGFCCMSPLLVLACPGGLSCNFWLAEPLGSAVSAALTPSLTSRLKT